MKDTQPNSELFAALSGNAIASFDAGLFDEALALALEALALRPLHVGCLILVGDSYYFLEQFEQAEAHFRKAMELKPHSEMASTGLHASLLSQHLRASGSRRLELQAAMQAEIKRFLLIADSPEHEKYLAGYIKVLKLTPNEREEDVVADMKQELREGDSFLFDELTRIMLKAEASLVAKEAMNETAEE